MTIYSHSRLNTFEQCPKKFKFKYLDKIIPSVETSIEAHVGKSVHEALEWLYKEIKNEKLPALDEVLLEYKKSWDKEWDPNMKNPTKRFSTDEHYNRGIRFLLEYYMKHKPFDDNTLDIEKKIIIILDEEGKYKLQGFIDRLVYNLETEEYEIHDYKTSGNLPNSEKIEKDRQLALYSIAIKEKFGHDKEVALVWHYLAFNRRIYSKRTNEQLDQLKKDTIELIENIESTKEFPPKKSALCNWCEYKAICHAWNKDLPETKEEAEKILREADGKISDYT